MNEDEKNIKRLPIHKIKDGAIEVSVWNNTHTDTKGISFNAKSVTITRNYKKDDAWAKSESVPMKDVPKLILALTDAYLKR